MSDAPEPTAVDQQGAIGEATVATAEDLEKQAAVKDYSKSTNDQLSMHVKVYSPFNDYYDGQAFSLTAESATGTFDILPKHHNFISLLEPCELVLRTVAKGEQRIRIAGGLIHVKADEVIIFLDI